MKKVNRDNIKTSAYVQTQQSLNARGISSFVEIIPAAAGRDAGVVPAWPFDALRIGADSFVVYPLLLMNNVELADRRDEFGLVTVRDPDPNSEAEIVVQTSEVDREAYNEGLRYMYAVVSLYCLRGLWCLGRYLHNSGTMDYGELFRRFVRFAEQRPHHPYSEFCERSIRMLDSVTFSNIGALDSDPARRTEGVRRADGRIRAAQEFWSDPVAQFLFEVDLINRPYIYKDTPIHAKPHDFRQLRVSGIAPDGYAVEIAPQYLSHLREHLALGGDDPSATPLMLAIGARNCPRCATTSAG